MRFQSKPLTRESFFLISHILQELIDDIIWIDGEPLEDFTPGSPFLELCFRVDQKYYQSSLRLGYIPRMSYKESIYRCNHPDYLYVEFMRILKKIYSGMVGVEVTEKDESDFLIFMRDAMSSYPNKESSSFYKYLQTKEPKNPFLQIALPRL